MKIKTKSGFTCDINEKKFKDWRFVKALAKCDSSNEMDAIDSLSFIVPFLIGEDGDARLTKHLEDKDGIVSTEAVVEELKNIMELAGAELKKSQSSQA